MLQAPTNDQKTKAEASSKTAEPLSEKESQAHLLGWMGRSRQFQPLQQRENLATLQKAYGNQAVLRMKGRSPAISSVQGGVLQRKCACGNAAGSSGSCAECQSKQEGILQTKLQIGEAGHRYEQEADRVADQVMAASEHSIVSGAPPRIQRYARPATEGSDAAPASVDQTLVNPGMPLDQSLQQDMEQRFGYDFSKVRVHSSAKAEQSARDVNANAYTVGHNIVFGAGQFTLGTQRGRRLLAHELTHVVQQKGDLGANYLQRQDDLISEDSGFILADQFNQEAEEDEDEDVEDGDTEVLDLDTTPDFEIEPHGPEPFSTPEDISQPIELSDDGRLGILPGSKIKHIDVDQVSQWMTVRFFGSQKTIGHRISTGRGECGTVGDPCKTQSEHHCTPNGTFLTISRGNANTKNSKGDAMAWFVGLRVSGRQGIGIHNSQIAFGTPRSHGCVRTGKGAEPEQFAKFINQNVLVGKTDVTISGKAKTTPYPCPKKKKKNKP